LLEVGVLTAVPTQSQHGDWPSFVAENADNPKFVWGSSGSANEGGSRIDLLLISEAEKLRELSTSVC
jgi:hypothetical protein